jgi:ketosteroid isomerase-like protein
MPQENVEIVRRHIGAFLDDAPRSFSSVEGLTDLGSGAILAVVTETGRGKGSGVPVRRSFAALYTVIDGKIVRITQFPSEEQALKAIGPPE